MLILLKTYGNCVAGYVGGQRTTSNCHCKTKHGHRFGRVGETVVVILPTITLELIVIAKTISSSVC